MMASPPEVPRASITPRNFCVMCKLTSNPCKFLFLVCVILCVLLLCNLFCVICGGCYMDKSRKWLLTINNPLKHDLTHKDIIDKLSTLKKLNYWCLCDEVGEKGTYHTHVFLYLSLIHI